MLQEAVLRRHFVVKNRKGWICLESKNPAVWRKFQTRRIAKVVAETGFLFTIGATLWGKRHKLDVTLERIITDRGLAVRTQPTTNGRLRHEKLYLGFDLATCSAETLEHILRHAEEAVIKCC